MVCVTGGTGMLGAHVMLELLKAGKDVRALKLPTSDVAEVSRIFSYYTSDFKPLLNRIQWVEGSISDTYAISNALDGVEEVYHCAAIVSFNPKDEQQLQLINVEGTANMVNVALEKGVRKFCHVSSIAAVGSSDKLITEETYWKSEPGTSSYSISKYGAEREVWRAVEEGLNVVIVNPGVIIGPGNWKTSSSNMFSTANKGLRFYTEGVTSFVDVRDVAKIMCRLMESPIKNERFIISSENRSFRDFFDYASVGLNKPKPTIKAGKFLSEIAWRAEKIKSSFSGANPLITRETARSAHQQKRYSNAKIKSALGFEFIPFEQSIRDTCNLFLKGGN